MLKQEIINNYLKKDKYVYMKVSYKIRDKKAVLEVTDHNLNVLETVERNCIGEEDVLGLLQRDMVHKAGEYQNKGFYPIINPFTD